jgi:hypothetical protein
MAEKELKERLDRCEAALEKAGYMVWDDATGKFKVVGTSDEPSEPAPPASDPT